MSRIDNPFYPKYDKLKKLLLSYQNEYSLNKKTIMWFDSFDVKQVKNEIESLRTDVYNREKSASYETQSLKDFSEKLNKTKSKRDNLVSYCFSYFSDKNKNYRNQIVRITSKISETKNKLNQINIEIDRDNAKINSLRESITRYNETDIAKLKVRQNEIADNYNQKVKLYKKLESIYNVLEEKLREINSSIESKEELINELDSKIYELNNFRERLNNATSSSDRKIIHLEIEDAYGTGNPNFLINKFSKEKNRYSYDLEKLKRKGNEITKGYIKSVFAKNIVIDGNNLCYINGIFIGFCALIAILKAINTRFESIELIFDASICHLLKKSISEIRNSFKDFDRVEVHIVQSHKSADETIIHIASSNESCYILSNDRYADYPGYDAIENDRIFRFEITKNKILIYDLDLDVTF